MKRTDGRRTRAGQAGVLVVVAALGSLAGACTEVQTIRPPEESAAEAPKGYSAAQYSLEAKGAPVAEVKVWSVGAELLETTGHSASLALVGFHMTNNGDDVISFAGESLLLDAGTATGYSVNNVRSLDAPSSMDIAPAEAREMQARFELPGRPAPRDVQAFRVHWSVTAKGETFTVITPFLRAESRRLSPDNNGFYYSPHYDPFYEGAFVYRSIVMQEKPFKHEHYQSKAPAH